MLAGAGANLAQVVKTTVFLVDMADFEAMNEAYLVGFGDHRPARSAVAVAALPRAARVRDRGGRPSRTVIAVAPRHRAGCRRARLTPMAGAVAIVAVLVLFPVVFLMSMSVLAAVLGATLKRDVENRYEGSELVDLNT